MTYVYNRDKEQKLGGVFSERVPAPTRIFLCSFKIEGSTPLNNVYKGGLIYNTTSSRAFDLGLFLYPKLGVMKEKVPCTSLIFTSLINIFKRIRSKGFVPFFCFDVSKS